MSCERARTSSSNSLPTHLHMDFPVLTLLTSASIGESNPSLIVLQMENPAFLQGHRQLKPRHAHSGANMGTEAVDAQNYSKA